MSWDIKRRLKDRLKEEEGAIVKEWGGRCSVALAYPNAYRIGMANLAVHSLYGMLGSRLDVACERAFLPFGDEMASHTRAGAPLMSLESQRPLADFDVVAFTISFENDYLNILPILDLARIPHRPSERTDAHPILIAGGAAPTLNPFPISRFFDAIALGEAEGFADDLIPLIARGREGRGILDQMAGMQGVFMPAHWGGGDIKRRHIESLDGWKTQTAIHSRRALFGGMHLIEVQRGCPFGCRFCATPGLYAPPRQRGLEAILEMVDDGFPHRKRFGLIGAHILSHPNFADIARAILARGATFSPSSVRAEDIDDERAGLLAEGGLRSVALGVEAGSDELRAAAGKRLTSDRILEAVATLARHGITRIKPYFMVGLPGEGEGDIEAIARLSLDIRAAISDAAPKGAKGAKVDLTVSPFCPKPGTPFARERFAGEAVLRSRMKLLRRLLAGKRGIGLRFEAPLSAAIEAYLAMAGEEASDFLEDVHATGDARGALMRAR